MNARSLSLLAALLFLASPLASLTVGANVPGPSAAPSAAPTVCMDTDALYQLTCTAASALDGALQTANPRNGVKPLASPDYDNDGRPDLAEVTVVVPAVPDPTDPTANLVDEQTVVSYVQLDYFFTPPGSNTPPGNIPPLATGSFKTDLADVMVYTNPTTSSGVPERVSAFLTNHYNDETGHIGLYQTVSDPAASYAEYGNCLVCIDTVKHRLAENAGPAERVGTATPGMLVPTSNGLAIDLDTIDPQTSRETTDNSIIESPVSGAQSLHSTPTLLLLNIPALNSAASTTKSAGFPDGTGLDFSYIHIKWPGDRGHLVDLTGSYSKYSNLDDDQSTDAEELGCTGQVTNPTNPNAWCGDWDGDGTLNGADANPRSPDVTLTLAFTDSSFSSSEAPFTEPSGAFLDYTCQGTASNIHVDRSLDGAAFVTLASSLSCAAGSLTLPAPATFLNADPTDKTVTYRLSATNTKGTGFTASTSFTLLGNTPPGPTTNTLSVSCVSAVSVCDGTNTDPTIRMHYAITGVDAGDEASQGVSSVKFDAHPATQTSPGTYEADVDYTARPDFTATATIVDTGGASRSYTVPMHLPFRAAPTLTAMSQTLGSSSGGGSITLTGSGFFGAPTVRFGTAPASATLVDDSHITATIPAHASGAVSIVVTNPDGQSATRAGFVYDAPPTAAPSDAQVYEDISTGGNDLVDITLLVHDTDEGVAATITHLSAKISYTISSEPGTPRHANVAMAPVGCNQAGTSSGANGVQGKVGMGPAGLWCKGNSATAPTKQKMFVTELTGLPVGATVSYQFTFTDTQFGGSLSNNGADLVSPPTKSQVADAKDTSKICKDLSTAAPGMFPGAFPGCLTASISAPCNPQGTGFDAVACAKAKAIGAGVPPECLTGTANSVGPCARAKGIAFPSECDPVPTDPMACASALLAGPLGPECNPVGGFDAVTCGQTLGAVCSGSQTFQDRCVPVSCVPVAFDATGCATAIACPEIPPAQSDLPCVPILPVPGTLPDRCPVGPPDPTSEPCTPHYIPDPTAWVLGNCNGLEDLQGTAGDLSGVPLGGSNCSDLRDNPTLAPLAQAVMDQVTNLDPNSVLSQLPPLPGDQGTFRDDQGDFHDGAGTHNGQLDLVEQYVASYDITDGRENVHVYVANGLTPPAGETYRLSIGDRASTAGVTELLVIRNAATWTCVYEKAGSAQPMAGGAKLPAVYAVSSGATEAQACNSPGSNTDYIVTSTSDGLSITNNGQEVVGISFTSTSLMVRVSGQPFGYELGSPSIFDTKVYSGSPDPDVLGTDLGMHPCTADAAHWCLDVPDAKACADGLANDQDPSPCTDDTMEQQVPDGSGSVPTSYCDLNPTLPGCADGCSPLSGDCLPFDPLTEVCSLPSADSLPTCGGDPTGGCPSGPPCPTDSDGDGVPDSADHCPGQDDKGASCSHVPPACSGTQAPPSCVPQPSTQCPAGVTTGVGSLPTCTVPCPAGTAGSGASAASPGGCAPNPVPCPTGLTTGTGSAPACTMPCPAGSTGSGVSAASPGGCTPNPVPCSTMPGATGNAPSCSVQCPSGTTGQVTAGAPPTMGCQPEDCANASGPVYACRVGNGGLLGLGIKVVLDLPFGIYTEVTV